MLHPLPICAAVAINADDGEVMIGEFRAGGGGLGGQRSCADVNDALQLL